MIADPDRKVLTVEEARRWLGISRGSIYEAIRQGQIPSIRIGRRILVPRAALLELLRHGSTYSSAEGSQDLPEKDRNK